MKKIRKTMISILKNSFTTACFLVLFVWGLLLAAVEVKAQEAVALSVSPTLFEMTANPGQDWSSSIRVINPNRSALHVYVEAVNFVPKGESGQPKFLPIVKAETEGHTIAEWMNFRMTEVVIPPEQTVEIPFSIKLPADAQPGGHFAAVLVGTKPPKNDERRTQVETSQIVTSLLFLRVAGSVVEEGNVRSFRPTEYLFEQPEVTFELRFENSGNVHIQPQGEIKIKNMWGQERGVIPVNRETLFGNVLPDSVRKFTFTWSGEWSVADIGRYSAVATLAYGAEQRQFASSETSFWVLPWKILSVVLLILLSFIALMTWLIKLYIRKMLSLAGVTPGSAPVARAQQTSVQKVSVVAPIEAGILDLSDRLKTSETMGAKFTSLYQFLFTYRLFFMAGTLVLLFSVSAVWYIQSASVGERGYEVTITGSEAPVTLSSEDIEYSELRKQQPDLLSDPVTEKEFPAINLVNQSGINGYAAKLKLQLETEGYTVANLDTDFNLEKTNTVIVYAPEYAAEAFELSQQINGALLSAFAEASGSAVPITVYVGRDYESGVQ